MHYNSYNVSNPTRIHRNSWHLKPRWPIDNKTIKGLEKEKHNIRAACYTLPDQRFFSQVLSSPKSAQSDPLFPSLQDFLVRCAKGIGKLLALKVRSRT